VTKVYMGTSFSTSSLDYAQECTPAGKFLATPIILDLPHSVTHTYTELV